MFVCQLMLEPLKYLQTHKTSTMDVDRIAPIFKGRHILITGGERHKPIINSNCELKFVFFVSGTGFMGKVLIDKLLRMTEVGKIYMLMRVKKGIEPKQRLVDTFNNPVRDSFQTSHHVLEAISDEILKYC